MVSQSSTPKLVTITGDRLADHANKRLTVKEIKTLLERALAWLSNHDDEAEVEWEVVRMALGDPVRITFRSFRANGSISDRLHNLNELQKKRMPKVAPTLTDQDVDGTIELAEMIGPAFRAIRISSPNEPTVKLNDVLIKRINEVAKVTRGQYFEWGAVRGFLDQVTTGKTSNKLRVRLQLSEDTVHCVFTDELLPDVKDALKNRVEVYGRVKYGRDNKPKSVEVRTIRKLPMTFIPFDNIRPVDVSAG